MPSPLMFSKPLFSVLYFLSCTLISSISLNWQLYANDTRLFFCLRPLNFDSTVINTHLQSALQEISFWLTANLLTVNYSKTELRLVRLKKQLVKVYRSSLNTNHFARNLGFVFNGKRDLRHVWSGRPHQQ